MNGHMTWQKQFQRFEKLRLHFRDYNSCPPDEGVMIELGIAIALKKEIFYLEMILEIVQILMNTFKSNAISWTT